MRWSLSHLACASTVLISLIVPLACALHESDAGVVDWHKLLVGVPLVGAPVTAPAFHLLNLYDGTENSTGGGSGKEQNVIYTATANNVLAALNPEDGSVVWRYIYEPEDRIAGYYPHMNFVATLSGPGGATLRIFDAVKGVMNLEKRLHSPEMGHLAEPHHLGTYVEFGGNGEIYVLADGHIVRRIDIGTGEVRWTWAAEDQTALTVHTHLLATSTALYVIGLSKSFQSLTLHVTTLDLKTGTVLSSKGVPSSIKNLDAYVLLSNSTQAITLDSIPHVAWLENSVLKSLELTPKLDAKPSPVLFRLKAESNAVYERILDVGLARHGYALAVTGDGSAKLLGINAGKVEGVGAFTATTTSKRNKINDKEKQDDEEENTDSVWVGSNGENGEVILGRVFWSHVNNKLKMETMSCTHTGSTFSTSASTVLEIDFNTLSHGIVAHAVLSPTHRGSSPSLLLSTTTGTVQSRDLSSKLKEKWTREEALAAIVIAEFVELPGGPADEAGVVGRRDKEGFFDRAWRHVGDAKNLPQYLNAFIRRFLTGSYASSTSLPIPASPLSTSSLKDGLLSRDAFGFRQIIVAATVQGKVFALDSSNGRVIWSRVLGLGWAAEVGANILPVKMFILGSEDLTVEGNDQEQRGPQVILVAQRRADNTLVDTVIFHIDALTGADASQAISTDPELQLADHSDSLLQGIDIISGPAVEAFLLPPPSSSFSHASASHDYAKAVLLLDEYLQVYLYPSTPRTRATLQALQPTLHFPLRTNTPSGTRIVGHAIGPHLDGEKGIETEAGERGFVAHPTWTLNLPPGEDVKAMLPATRGPVASLGKVLGNRTTLYKYLNPRLLVVLTTPRPATIVAMEGHDNNKGEQQTCGVYVVDAAKGSIVYRAGLPAFLGKGKEAGKEACDVKTSLVENWLVYHYYDPEWAGSGLSKGWRMVSVELYEGKDLDDKTMSSDMSSYSGESANVVAFEQSYVFSHPITALTTTSTKFGMTSKDVIVANRAHQIQSVQRRLLNPRRPHRKVTAEEQEEFLIPYEPILAYDPRRVLSHHYEVANIQRIITAPALLESTSLVFAYGLDMFLTRVAPSNTFDVLNENFNKAQLVLIVGCLALAIVFTKPMVKRKGLRERWYSNK